MSRLEAVVSGGEAIADWLETTLLTRGTRQLGTDAVLSLAVEELGCSEPQANIGISTMKRRADVLGESYPFLVLNNLAVRARPGAIHSPYAALLLLTSGSVARQTVRTESTSEMEILLERISEAALANLWGPESRALRFGYPSEHGRPLEFGPAIDWLAAKMGIASGSGYRPPRRKDGGVDVVAWRPFPDGRSGFPVVLAQCTLQAELFAKAADVDVRIWSTWLSLDFEPQTALAVPQTIGTGVLWDQLALRCMVFDRIRLTGLLEGQVAIDGMTQWTSETIGDLVNVLMGSEV